MRKLVFIISLFTAFACSSDKTDALNAGSAMDSGVCDPATDFFCLPDTGVAPVDADLDAGNGGKGDKVDGGKPDDKPMGQTLYRVSGELNTTTQQGYHRFEVLIGQNQEPDCDVRFEVATATTTDDCAQCDFAWLMVLGTKTTDVDGAGCVEQKLSTGEEIGYGHSGNVKLYLRKQGVWTAFGESKLVGDVWNYSLEYAF